MAIHTDKLRWLFWLRWKTLLRGYSRRPLSIIGSILILLFFEYLIQVSIGVFDEFMRVILS